MERSVSPSLRLESNECWIWDGVALTRQDALVEACKDESMSDTEELVNELLGSRMARFEPEFVEQQRTGANLDQASAKGEHREGSWIYQLARNKACNYECAGRARLHGKDSAVHHTLYSQGRKGKAKSRKQSCSRSSGIHRR